ncbi:MAG: hypothetical protein QF864_02720, partial [SAR202 cluster bacterium]|nr:hypothetical protein [SAR202 cluster bacterium]
MAKFSDRIFGNNVHPDVIKIFDNLQKGSFQKEPLEEAQPTHQDYIGDRTTFARMWTASLISGSIVDEEGKPDGTTTQKVVFNVVNDNRDDSYVEINEPVGDLISKELTDNPYLKPKAGIRSVTTRNEGSLGVIKNTKVEFTVHNKKDFEEIFLPFFMKPGATVVVDYGWSDKSFQLYDVKKQVENTDLELSEFKKYIYGGLKTDGAEDIVYQDTDGSYYSWEDDEKKRVEYQEGFLGKNIGLVDTIIGIVKGYDATVNQQGSFECSIDLVSQNTTLLDQEITEENNLKFIFANRIEDAIINVLLGEGSSVNANLRYINSLGSQAKQSLLNDFFEEKLEISQPDKQDLGIIPKKAVK